MKIDDNITTLFLGNSRMADAVNDSIIPNSFNFAHAGDRMDLIYAKLKLIHKANPQIKTVVLEIDNSTLQKTSLFSPSLNHPFYFDQYSIADWLENIKGYSLERNLQRFTIFTDRNTISNLLKAHSDPRCNRKKMGAFMWQAEFNLENSIKSHRSRHRNLINQLGVATCMSRYTALSEINLYYLQKFYDYCRKNNLNLKFITTPEYPFYKGDSILNPIFTIAYQQYRTVIKSYYPDIPHYDVKDKVYPDSARKDCIHLNYIGARMFSNELLTFLNDSDDKVQ